MSPFAQFLRTVRQRRGLKQKDVADLLGYEQSYLSALERSVKGPPRHDFLSRLVRGLKLTPAERSELNDALRLSRRQIVLPANAPQEEYALIRALEPQLGNLSEQQIALIQIALSLPMSTASDHEQHAHFACARER
ncbi:helix-turn-helix domain-containing protein [Orrella marina]|uniref:XRE family transcriptional regulator n=1 Tax=Orrella marina TaxID=2163011 RepID=A0A2R4XLM4_9BURK|nr:helix-turn-helix transcriptional regulator [Orrella marina]AWB34708.1 XRE family transcriptional regulator [Orrella marina]